MALSTCENLSAHGVEIVKYALLTNPYLFLYAVVIRNVFIQKFWLGQSKEVQHMKKHKGLFTVLVCTLSTHREGNQQTLSSSGPN